MVNFLGTEPSKVPSAGLRTTWQLAAMTWSLSSGRSQVKYLRLVCEPWERHYYNVPDAPGDKEADEEAGGRRFLTLLQGVNKKRKTNTDDSAAGGAGGEGIYLDEQKFTTHTGEVEEKYLSPATRIMKKLVY